jgi:hypothetical protein
LPVKEFEGLLLESIDKALSSMGEGLKNAAYVRLQESFGIAKQEIPYNVEAFTKTVESVLGSEASRLKILILRQLYEKNGWSFRKNEFNDLGFLEYLERARGRLYTELINNIQTGVAIFHLGDASRSASFKLIAINSSAMKIAGVEAEKALGKTVTEVFPEISRRHTDIKDALTEIVGLGKAKNLGEFHSSNQQAPQGIFHVMAYLFANNCVGLVFKSVVEPKSFHEETPEKEERFEKDATDVGEWKWESETIGRQVRADRFRVRERWIRKEITREPRDAEYCSLRGKECLENGDFPKAREFFSQAEEVYQRLNKIEDAFENASLRIRTYLSEENVDLQRYFETVEEYFHKYADFSMHEYFLTNLAYYSQWKGYEHYRELRFHDARASYAQAEETFLILKQKSNALFSASQRILTYKRENKLEEYEKTAEEFFETYSEFAGSKHYKEVRAHYCSSRAEESNGLSRKIEFRNEAERLFLEINQRELAFENACKLADLYSDNFYSNDEQAIRSSFNEIEKFFERYKDFSEHEHYRKRLAEYYLLQARALTSQLKQVLH